MTIWPITQEKGFSILGVDYSEHHASRFKNGVVGWLELAGGMDAWRQAVAEIAFSLDGGVGEVSPVITRPEGVFLVRVMDRKAQIQRSFDSVAAQLEREERDRLRRQVESDFTKQVEATYPVEGLSPGMISRE